MKELEQTMTPGGTAIIFGSDNVFVDLGFSDEEAANLQVRSLLLQRLQAYVKDEGLTQEEAADRLGVHQPRVSQLMRGKIGAFSIDALVNMLAAAGLRIRVAIEPAA